MILMLLKAFADVSIGSNDLNLANKNDLSGNSIANILKIVFGVAGAVSVLVITLGGFRYVISQGNPQETAKAKDTIIYAIIGLIICIFAFVITGFVTNSL